MRKKAMFAAGVALVAGAVAYLVFDRRQAEPALARDGPVLAFRIDQSAPAGSEVLHGLWPVTNRISLQDPIRVEVLAALHDPANFRSGSSRCFSPGMAFRVGSGDNAVDALVCLECNYASLSPTHKRTSD